MADSADTTCSRGAEGTDITAERGMAEDNSGLGLSPPHRPKLGSTFMDQIQRRGITVELKHKLKECAVHKSKIEPAKETAVEFTTADDEIDYDDPACYQFGQKLTLCDIECQMSFRISRTDSTTEKAPCCYVCIHVIWPVSAAKPTYHVGFSDRDSPDSSDCPQKTKLANKSIKAEVKMSESSPGSMHMHIKIY